MCKHRGAKNVLQGVCSKFQFGNLTKLTSETYILTHVASGRWYRAKVYPSAASRKSLSLIQWAHWNSNFAQIVHFNVAACIT